MSDSILLSVEPTLLATMNSISSHPQTPQDDPKTGQHCSGSDDRNSLRILVVGAGGVGGYFGGRLAQAGRDVTFLVRPRRAEELKANGLKIISPHGDVTITPRLALTGDVRSTYDVVLLAVKAYTLDAAIDDFAFAVGSETMIVPFLNGMKHMDLLTARFGKSAVLGGVCFVATTLKDDGSVVQLEGFQSLSYGEVTGEKTPRLEKLDQSLQDAGFEAKPSGQILHDMWQKWVFLATAGGITCLLRGNVGEIEAAPGGAGLARQFLAECCAVSSASGYVPEPAFVAKTESTLTAPGSKWASSMYRDLSSGRPVEADQIIGDLVERARQVHVPAPLLAAAFAHLKIYQNRLSAA